MNEVLSLIKNNFFSNANKLHRNGIVYDKDSQLYNFFNAKKNAFDKLLLAVGYSREYKGKEANKVFKPFNFIVKDIKYDSNTKSLKFYLKYIHDFNVYLFVKNLDE